MIFQVWLRRSRQAFTLVELLVVIIVIAVLAAIFLPVFSQVASKGNQMKTLSNMRQVGTAFMLYANDNNNQLPGRVLSGPKWTTLLASYVGNVQVYNSPVPSYLTGTFHQVSDPNLLTSSSYNYTSYIANGYNDVSNGSLTANIYPPRLNLISTPSQVILLGIPYPQKNNYYMDFSEGLGNNYDILDKKPWSNGSIYVFTDGSSRFLQYRSTDVMTQPPTSSDYYTDWLWLIYKNSTVIQPPPPTS